MLKTTMNVKLIPFGNVFWNSNLIMPLSKYPESRISSALEKLPVASLSSTSLASETSSGPALPVRLRLNEITVNARLLAQTVIFAILTSLSFS